MQNLGGETEHTRGQKRTIRGSAGIKSDVKRKER